jgi:hypothetical protein
LPHSKFYHELSTRTALNPSNDVNGETCFSNQPQLVFHLIASDENETIETTVSDLNLGRELDELVQRAATDEIETNNAPSMMKSDRSAGDERQRSERQTSDCNTMRERDNIIFAASTGVRVRERGGVCFDADRVKSKCNDKPGKYSLLSAQIKRANDSDGVGTARSDSEIDRNRSVRSYGDGEKGATPFPSVEKLIKMYASLVNDQTLVKAKPETKRGDQPNIDQVPKVEVGELKFIEQFDTEMNVNRPAPNSDEGFSGDEEIEAGKYAAAEKVTRSCSSDSALGIDEEVNAQPPVVTKRRATLTVSDIPLRPALLPVAMPSSLQGSDLLSPSNSEGNSPTIVRSRILLEEQLIELPSSETDDFDTVQMASLSSIAPTHPSRRESTVSDFEGVGPRYVRTPSVVLSDYCDEMVGGITLEDIEYLRRHRLNRKKSDAENDSEGSATSSCSNLNYCGSTISALDMDYQYEFTDGPQRKVSSCSTCSLITCDEDDEPPPSEPIKPKRKVSQITRIVLRSLSLSMTSKNLTVS